jgi:SAM-dependent methyltransferase
VDYHQIAEHYERCLAEHGDSHLGVDWPKAEDVPVRHEVMLGVIRPPLPQGRPVRLLDFGCGASHLYEHLLAHGREGVEYAGIDISQAFVDLSRRKFPQNRYWCLDLLEDDAPGLPRFDYAVLNGVFTEKVGMSFDEMSAFFRALLVRVFALVDHGLAFNVMSKHVDWERDDLFHLPFDDAAAFLARDVSRHVVLRSDYGLYEYTVYVYREPGPRPQPAGE